MDVLSNLSNQLVVGDTCIKFEVSWLNLCELQLHRKRFHAIFSTSAVVGAGCPTILLRNVDPGVRSSTVVADGRLKSKFLDLNPRC